LIKSAALCLVTLFAFSWTAGVGATAAAVSVPDGYRVEREKQWFLLRHWLSGGVVAREAASAAPVPDESLRRLGSELFGVYCANCHGKQGKGDGPRAAALQPPPRDFTAGLFKFRSTPSGSLPTRDDLFHTLSGGLRGTAMMPFADLAEIERWALVEQVRVLAGAQDGKAAVALTVPSAAGRADEGRELYAKLECASCHGERGRGDGPSAAALEDWRGRPLPPPDFATRPFKRGQSADDVYLTLATGLDGTAMPAYAEAATPAELRDLAAWVLSLKQEVSLEAGAVEQAEARAVMQAQASQGSHAVVGGCGCKARRAAAAAEKAAASPGAASHGAGGCIKSEDCAAGKGCGAASACGQ